MRVKLREDLNSDELPAGWSDAPLPLRSPGKRPELSLQARGAKHGAELRGGKLKLELGRASGGTQRCANAPPQSGKASRVEPSGEGGEAWGGAAGGQANPSFLNGRFNLHFLA